MLTTLASVKTAIGIPTSDTTQDALLTQLIGQCDAAMKTWLGRPIEQATYTEWYSGKGTAQLRLYQYPALSITSLYLDPGGYFGKAPGAFAAGTLLTEGIDFVLRYDEGGTQSGCGMVIRIGGYGNYSSAVAFARGDDEDWMGGGNRRGSLSRRRSSAWPSGKGNIQVTYVAGYATVPLDLQLACNELCAWYRQGRKQGAAVTSASYDGFSQSVQATESGKWPNTVMNVLNRYRKIVI